MKDREKYLARQHRYNHSAKGRARWYRYWLRRMTDDPLFALHENQRKTLSDARKALEAARDRAERLL